MIKTVLLKILLMLLVSILTLANATAEVSPQESLREIYQNKQGSYPVRTRHLDAQGEPIYTNRLIRESSLYLLHHAHNPVDWWSWGDAALAAARDTDKPILLSIGYSSCHWCHVMERESFEDPAIADFINEHFIAIKIDREQHPDIDELYMTAVQRLSGSAGWPLTAVLTPDGKPFFGGTYFPPARFQETLQRISSAWQNNRDAVQEQADRVHQALVTSNQRTAQSFKLNDQTLTKAFGQIAQDFAASSVTTSGSAFPREPETIALLEQAILDPKQTTIDTLLERLKKIANSGLHDHIGGGFHRYSVDPNWQVPHFEKMLYNQAQMADAYLKAWQLSGDNRFKEVALATFEFMTSDLQDPEGGFYSAVDAESGGEEGGYYTWTTEQLVGALDTAQIQSAVDLFALTPRGNFANTNVLQYRPATTSKERATQIKQALATARKQRIAPITDTKLITGWNAMAIQALVVGHQALGQLDYLDAALRAGERIWNEAWQTEQGKLTRTVATNSMLPTTALGVLQDYAHLGVAFIALYDKKQDIKWLHRSEQLADALTMHFFDPEAGAFRTSASTGQQDNPLLVNLINARDDAIYSGNSAAAQLFTKLYHRTGNLDHRDQARSVLATFTDSIIRQPQSHSGLLRAASWLVHGETGAVLYAAKAKVAIRATADKTALSLTISTEPGWHINAATVLEKELIPTRLNSKDWSCWGFDAPEYPQGKRVSLGFQTTPLLVYEESVALDVPLKTKPPVHNSTKGCPLLSAELNLQACSNEVCLSPQTLQLRVPVL